jgi:trimethylamine:corrinoid methyltransferase-like protein
MNFCIPDPFSPEQWSRIDEEAMHILQKVGLKVQHAPTLAVLREKAGVHVNGEEVRFEPEVVSEQIRGIGGSGEYDTPVIAGAYSHLLMDPDTNEVRAPRLEDLVRCIRQADALDMGVCCPIVPIDVSGPRQELIMERVTHENARFSYGGGQHTTLAAAEAALEMGQAVGRVQSMEVWVTSPLKIDAQNLDMAWKLRDKKPPVRVNSMPVRGMTGPMPLPGLLALSAAECYGAATVVRLLNVAGRLSYREDAFAPYSMQMNTASVLLSGPEFTQLSLLRVFHARHNGIKNPSAKLLFTTAKMPDLQAGTEKASGALAIKLAGAGCYMAAGTLGGVDIFSPIQLMMDHEIMRYVQKACAPFEFSEDGFLRDVIGEVGAGGSFLDQESTLRNLHETVWQPKLFDESVAQSWLKKGRPSITDKARDTLNALSLRDGPAVSPEVQKELLRIEEYFMSRLERS